MIPCLICNDGSNAIFDHWEILSEGTLEILCAVFICKSCASPTYVQKGVRTRDIEVGEDEDEDEDESSAGSDIAAGWEY